MSIEKTQKKLEVANAFHVYARLFTYVRRYLGVLVIAAIARILYSSIDAWFVYFLKPLLNEGLVGKNRAFLTWAPFLVMGIFILRGIMAFFSSYYIAHASRGVIMSLRQNLF